jgi:hypothetical protein
MEHPVQRSDDTVLIADQRKVQRRALSRRDVFGPEIVRLDVVDTDADKLRVALGELVFAVGERPEFGCANRGEIGRVLEQDAPSSAEALMETQRALCSFDSEVVGLLTYVRACENSGATSVQRRRTCRCSPDCARSFSRLKIWNRSWVAHVDFAELVGSVEVGTTKNPQACWTAEAGSLWKRCPGP